MNLSKKALIDSGPLVAYYNAADEWHKPVSSFYENFKGELLTTESVVTEVMYLLADDWRVQCEFLADCSSELYRIVPLKPTDFVLISQFNEKYNDRPSDFADLSLVAIAERLQIFDIVSLDSDFDIYRGYNKKAFKQLFPKKQPPR